jgi:hypothetical protein
LKTYLLDHIKEVSKQIDPKVTSYFYTYIKEVERLAASKNKAEVPCIDPRNFPANYKSLN